MTHRTDCEILNDVRGNGPCTCAPHALTREQEVGSDGKWSKEDDLLSGDPESLPKLIAALRLALAQQAQELQQWRNDYSVLSCKFDDMQKRCMAAERSCAEFVKQLDQQAQGIARQHQDFERATAKVMELRQLLAAMTAERDAAMAAKEQWREEWRTRTVELNTQLATSQARVRELEKECAGLAAGSCEAPYGDDYGNKRCKTIAHLQATLAARERVIQQQEATLKGYRHSFKIVGQQHDDRKDERDAIEKRYAVLEEDFTLACQQRDLAMQEAGRLREALRTIANTAHGTDHLHTLITVEDQAQRALSDSSGGKSNAQ